MPRATHQFSLVPTGGVGHTELFTPAAPHRRPLQGSAIHGCGRTDQQTNRASKPHSVARPALTLGSTGPVVPGGCNPNGIPIPRYRIPEWLRAQATFFRDGATGLDLGCADGMVGEVFSCDPCARDCHRDRAFTPAAAAPVPGLYPQRLPPGLRDFMKGRRCQSQERGASDAARAPCPLRAAIPDPPPSRARCQRR